MMNQIQVMDTILEELEKGPRTEKELMKELSGHTTKKVLLGALKVLDDYGRIYRSGEQWKKKK